MSDLVRSVFSDEVPDWELLEPLVRQYLAAESHTLSCLIGEIAEHIAERDPKGMDGDAISIAYSVVEGIIENLPVDEASCRLLQDFVSEYDSLNAYDRLVTDYSTFIPTDSLRDIVGRGRRAFIEEVTSHWPDIAVGAAAGLAIGAIVTSYGQGAHGALVSSIRPAWITVVKLLGSDWSKAFQIPPRRWEEIIAGAFDMEGFDEVTLTPRSGDHGRDVIAVRRGVGSIRIVGSVKALRPDCPVPYDDIRALVGVLHGDQNASKGILTTTSTFPTNVKADPFIAPFLPYRLELIDGPALQRWLKSLSM